MTGPATPQAAAAAGSDLAAPDARRQAGRMARLRRHPGVVIGALLLALLAIAAMLAPWLGTVDPRAVSPANRTLTPSAEFWFGTDLLGRDLYSRVIYGARVSLTVGLAVAFLATLAGTAIGLVAGYVRWSDGLLMRVMDGIMAVPPLLLAVALITLTRPSIGNVIVAITIGEVPRVARLVRSVVLTLREQAFIDAAITAGASARRIILHHILPNTIAPITVQATYIFASAMIIESILSFIGAGTPAGIPSWGGIIAEGRALWQVRPFVIFFPALFLSVAVLAVNMLGDGLRDITDPRMAEKL